MALEDINVGHIHSCSIFTKSCVNMQNLRIMTIERWRLKIQDCGRSPYWKSLYRHTSVK